MDSALGAGALSKLVDATILANNGGVVTVLAGGTQVVAADCGTVRVGDLLFVNALLRMMKGITGGASTILVQQSAGTAGIQAYFDEGLMQAGMDPQVSSSEWAVPMFTIFRVVIAGTLTIELRATSAGSNGTVSADDGQLAIYRFSAQ